MTSFKRTADLALIRSIIVSDSRIYEAMTDDTCPKAEDFQMPEDPSIWYVLAHEGEELLGFWALIPREEGTAELHTCLLPNCWRGRAVAAAKEFVRWCWENTPFTRLTTVVAAYNTAALKFAKRGGMKEYSVRTQSYPKYGEMHDLIELEMRRPELPMPTLGRS